MKWNHYEFTKVNNFKYKEKEMKIVKWLQARYKALIAGLGGVLVYLQGIQATNPNHWISIAIIALMVLGVHQIANQ